MILCKTQNVVIKGCCLALIILKTIWKSKVIHCTSVNGPWGSFELFVIYSLKWKLWWVKKQAHGYSGPIYAASKRHSSKISSWTKSITLILEEKEITGHYIPPQNTTYTKQTTLQKILGLSLISTWLHLDLVSSKLRGRAAHGRTTECPCSTCPFQEP